MKKRLITLTILALLLSGCSLYRMNIQQGNLITQEELSQLRPGMNQAQVQDILGTPLLKDDFRQNRWDYVFYLKEGNKEAKRSGITVFFNQAGQVTEIKQDKPTS
ncbi:MAG: hypothetical protein RLZZ215_1336 [Pseudomonadota bacterium]|jgi:outer membrane protein assembly factor BamE